MNSKIILSMVFVFVLLFSSTSFAYNLQLQKGWNLVGVPFASATLASGSNCIYSAIWSYYDGSYVSGDLSYNPIGLNYAGFFVYAKKSCTIQIQDLGGDKLSSSNLPSIWDKGGGAFNFKKGWNFIAGFSDSPHVAEIPGDCSIVNGPYYFDNPTNNWVASNYLTEGKGYIVKVAQDCKFGYEEPSAPPAPPPLP